VNGNLPPMTSTGKMLLVLGALHQSEAIILSTAKYATLTLDQARLLLKELTDARAIAQEFVNELEKKL
jgi:hypothetical protein